LDDRRDKLPYWIVVFNTLGVSYVRSFLMALERCINVEKGRDPDREHLNLFARWLQTLEAEPNKIRAR
jgi:hypothetical protein